MLAGGLAPPIDCDPRTGTISPSANAPLDADPATLPSGYTRIVMADPPPTRLHIDPPIDQWRVTGTPAPIIATGHQPFLWHPGILSKDLALDVLTQRIVCSSIHLVVDHNPVGPLVLDVPVRSGDALTSRRVFFNSRADTDRLPPNRLPPIPPSTVERSIESVQAESDQAVRSRLARIVQAYAKTGGRPSLAEQTTSVLGRFKSPYLNQHQGIWSTSKLVTQGFIDRLLADPVDSVRHYNRATLAYPEAGIRPLHVGRDVVEVPLWAQDASTCTPVYADLGDSAMPQLFTTAHNQHLDLTKSNAHRYLRPRAITLSAIMRSELCDLFIHGIGGGVYDQVTERWWHDWTGEDLAPKAVVSADMFLPFDVPTSTHDELARVKWFAHHLPHNIDRYVSLPDGPESTLRQEKRELLDRMNDDRDKRRRAKAFRRIHAINTELATLRREVIAEARKRAQDARVGVQNAAVASRRDWCFALYPDAALHGLRQSIHESIA